VLVIANLDHLGRYDPAGTEFYTQLIDWLNEHGITLLVTASGGPLLERLDFEYAVSVPKSTPSLATRTVAVCQRGDCNACIFQSMVKSGHIDCARSISDLRPPAA
jgi:hypothetical protein